MKIINPNKLAGKTIKRINHTSCNCWTWYFTDGTKAVIDTECKISTAYGGAYGPVIIEISELKRPKPQAFQLKE